jgi:predicted N-acyltransferase
MMRTSKLFQDYTYLDLDSFSKYCHLLHVLAEKPIKNIKKERKNPT